MKKILIALAFGYAALLSVSITPVARATSTNIITDFGSYLLSTISCTCTGATYMITMKNDGNEVLTLTYMPGLSALKLDYNYYTSGVQFLGQYTTDTGMCMIYVGESCETQTADGLITPSPYQGFGTTGQSVM